MKIVILEPLGIKEEKLWELKEQYLPDDALVYHTDRAATAEEIGERGKDADIVVIANQALPEEAIDKFECCKYLVVAFTGVDHVALDACKRKGILVSNCAGYSTAAVSELVFGMLIALQRRIIECDAAARTGGTKDGLVGPEIEGKTFGIIGTGAIGLQVAEVARALHCRVLAYSRTKKDIPGIEYTDLTDLLRQSDYVSIHVPSNPATKGLIGEAELREMKPTAVLINLARGPIVDSKALAAALNEERIAGACIDVLEMEPPFPADHPLVTARHTILTPHVAFASDEAMVKRAGIVFDNIVSYKNGEHKNAVRL